MSQNRPRRKNRYLMQEFHGIIVMMTSNADKLSSFTVDGEPLQTTFVETVAVKDGVSCDVYAFADDSSRDLAIVRVAKGMRTPLQRVLSGNSTREGLFEGQGTLTVRSEDGSTETYDFDSQSTDRDVEVDVGQIMQWAASADRDLIFYEICDPPYEDGRFENLPE